MLTVSRTDTNKNVVSQSITVTVAQVPTGTTTASPITCTAASQQLPAPLFRDQFGNPVTTIVGLVWTATTVPSGASAPTFTTTNSTTTATFTSPGTYGLAARPGGSNSASFSVTISVAQTLSSIEVTPATATVQAGATQQFGAEAFDQFGNLLPTQPTFTWVVSGGTISSSGLFTAPAQFADYTISAGSGSIAGGATVTVPDPPPPDPPDPSPAGLQVPTVTVTDGGGTFTGQPFPATASVAGVVSGVDTTPASSLEGVTPTLAYYAGPTADGTPMNGVPTAAGTYTVVASFAGSADYTAAQSTPLTFAIGQATPIVTVADAGGTFTGQPFPATASVSGVGTTPAASLENVAPTLTYYASGTPLESVPTAAGTYTVVASFAGSADYTAAQSTPLTFAIGQATPIVTVADAGGTFTGQPFPATASVSGVGTTPAASLENVAPTLTYYASGTPLESAPRPPARTPSWPPSPAAPTTRRPKVHR